MIGLICFNWLLCYRCGRCLCVMFSIPEEIIGPSQCGALDFEQTTKKGTPRTAAEIAAFMEGLKNNFNEGFYSENWFEIFC